MFPQSPKREPTKEYPELPVAKLAAQRKASPIAKISIIAAAAVIIIAGGLFLLFRQPTKPVSTVATTQSRTSTKNEQQVKLATTTKHYNSGTLFLGFDYPADWKVAEADSIEAVSPIVSLPNAKGSTSKGRIVFTIQPGQESLPALRDNTATAPIASTKLTYSSPTPSQRAQTYLTALNYRGESSVIDAFYVTGDNGYTAGQYVPASDISKANPLISLTFRGCNTEACDDKSSYVTLPVTAWQSGGLAQPLQKMIESLRID